MNNKEIAKQFIDNLFVNDEKAYKVVDDNIRVNWPGFGMEDIVGKENLQNFFNNGGPDKVINQTVRYLIAEGDTVIGAGTIITERNGKEETSHFADVYTITGGKISKLESYMVHESIK